MGPGPAVDRKRGCEPGGVERGTAVGPDFDHVGGRAQLSAASQHAGPDRDRPRQLSHCPRKCVADGCAQPGRTVDRPRRRQRIGTAGGDSRDPAIAGAAGGAGRERDWPVASPAPGGASDRTATATPRAARAAHGTGRRAVRTRPAPARHSPGGGAAARRHRRYRGRPGRFLSAHYADRQRVATNDPAEVAIQRGVRCLRVRAVAERSHLRRRTDPPHGGAARGAAARGCDPIPTRCAAGVRGRGQRPCCVRRRAAPPGLFAKSGYTGPTCVWPGAVAVPAGHLGLSGSADSPAHGAVSRAATDG